jgi:hypothetical protein
MHAGTRDTDDAAEEEGGGFGNSGDVGAGERHVIAVLAAAKVLAAGRVVVVEHVLVYADGDQAVVGVAVERCAVGNSYCLCQSQAASSAARTT